MQAIVVHEYGGPEQLQLEDVAIPTPGPGEVLVRVVAAGVGPWDALVRAGKTSLPERLPFTPGAEIAGTIANPGSASAQFASGDEVFGATNDLFVNGYADYALASATMIARKPPSLDFVAAASVPIVAATAWQMLFECARLTSGQRVLVHGAAGNVGAYAVQLAHLTGATVIAVVGSKDADFVRDMGATDVIDFHTQQFDELISGVDVVIDTVGGETQERSFRVLKPGGILVSSVAQPSAEKARQCSVRVAYFVVAATTSVLEQIAKLFDEGKLRVHVGAVLPLSEARQAHEMLAGSLPRVSGKIVLRTGP